MVPPTSSWDVVTGKNICTHRLESTYKKKRSPAWKWHPSNSPFRHLCRQSDDWSMKWQRRYGMSSGRRPTWLSSSDWTPSHSSSEHYSNELEDRVQMLRLLLHSPPAARSCCGSSSSSSTWSWGISWPMHSRTATTLSSPTTKAGCCYASVGQGACPWMSRQRAVYACTRDESIRIFF